MTSTRYAVSPQPGWTLKPAGAGFLITRPGTDLTGAEAQLVLGAMIAIGGGAASLTCKGVTKLKGQINSVACYQKRIVPNQGNWKIVNGKNCR